MSRNIVARLLRTAGTIAGAAALAGCGLLAALPEPTTLDQRLAMIPTSGHRGLDGALTIRWDDRHIPYIEAASEADAAYGLGIVHAHLRLGQMELARRLVHGRLSEVGGPLATELDHALRTLGLPRAAEDIWAEMPAETKTWVTRYVDGLNAYIASSAPLPAEFRLLNMKRERWSYRDVLGIGRLAGVDVNWLVWATLLPLRQSPEWDRIWQYALDYGQDSQISYLSALMDDAEDPDVRARAILAAQLLTRGPVGSNTIAVAPDRSASGAALIANDPHLGILLPNLWMIVGLKSPKYHAVGFMAPGLPVFGLGRTPHLAWGGTNMRAANSDLVDVGDLPAEAFTTETYDLKVRAWLGETRTSRLSPYGPVMTDAPAIGDRTDRQLALRWVGHRASDEITAYLKALEATEMAGFRAAFADYALPAQNVLAVDRAGTIAMFGATKLPARTDPRPPDIALRPDQSVGWDAILGTEDLPGIENPDAGFLLSANNKPTDSDIPLGWFFSPSDRVDRLATRLAGETTIDKDILASIQQDVTSPSSRRLQRALLARWDALDPPVDATMAPALDLIRAWNAAYDADSRGAVAFEAVVAALAPAAFRANDNDMLFSATGRSAYLMDQTADQMRQLDDDAFVTAVSQALTAAASALDTFATWGDAHRLVIGHPLANLPVVGDRFVVADLAAPGSTETVNKAAHDPLGSEPLASFYGSQARHISDMADPDANWFLLLGGQDGWINSQTYADHLDEWQAGELIQVPLSEDGVARRFTRRTILTD